MANDTSNRFAAKIESVLKKAEAARDDRDSAAVRRALAAIEKRQASSEDAILSVVQQIGKRLNALEKAVAGPTPEALQFLADVESNPAKAVELRRKAAIARSREKGSK